MDGQPRSSRRRPAGGPAQYSRPTRPSTTQMQDAPPSSSAGLPPPPPLPSYQPSPPAPGGVVKQPLLPLPLHHPLATSSSTSSSSSSSASLPPPPSLATQQHFAAPVDTGSHSSTGGSGPSSLSDMIPRIRNLGIPASCKFVLGLLERYFRERISGEPGLQHGSPSQEMLLPLIDLFVHHQSSPSSSSSSTAGAQSLSPLSAAEDVDVLMTVLYDLEGQQNLELRFCIFDALFNDANQSDQRGKFAFLSRLVSLAVSLESEPVLFVTALWMHDHHLASLPLAKAIFQDFCLLLPDAMDPVMRLAAVSPHFAHYIATAFTILHPFHLVGEPALGVDVGNLNPPIKMLQLVSHWVEKRPDFLHPPALIEPARLQQLPTLHSRKPSSHSSTDFHSKFLMTGLIQWCILTPLAVARLTETSRRKPSLSAAKTSRGEELLQRKPLKDSVSKSVKVEGSTHPSDDDKEMQGLKTQDSQVEMSVLVTKLHADLLSLIHAHSQLLGYQSVSGDNVAMVVASLLGLWKTTTKHRGGVGGGGGEGRDGQRKTRDAGRSTSNGEVGFSLEESIERLAQFLQISVSSGLLALKPDDLSSIASTLPKNRLLQLVMAHCHSSSSSSSSSSAMQLS